MKVKIKNKGKTEEFKLIESWEDVSLESWTRLVTAKTKTKSEEAIKVISELSNIPESIISKLELSDIAIIMARVGKMQSDVDTSLARIIEIDKKRYGFHPDLDSITLGEYADIETFIKNGIENHLPEVMAVLYRPVLEETGSGVYTIEAYDGEIKIRADQMKKMSSQQVQNALVFFYNFGKLFVMTLALSLTERLKAMKTQLPQTDSLISGRGSG
tara:strand:+ start:841 stop:1485 length:645 start_codon:yes stop_codon:yes gene_type:complete